MNRRTLVAGGVLVPVSIAALLRLSRHYTAEIEPSSPADHFRQSLGAALANLADRRQAAEVLAARGMSCTAARPPTELAEPPRDLPAGTALVMTCASPALATGRAFDALFRVDVYLGADDRVLGHFLATRFE